MRPRFRLVPAAILALAAALAGFGTVWAQDAKAISEKLTALREAAADRDLPQAEKLFAEFEALGPGDDGHDEARAHVLLAQGMLFTQNREWKKGRRAFLYAAALRRRNHRLFALGEVLAGYGQLLLRVREHKRALRIARRAEWIFTDLDARGQLKRIMPLLNAADGLSTSGSREGGGRVPLK